MILIAFGANLPSNLGSPVATYATLPQLLSEKSITVLRQSSLFQTKPVPISDQPDYMNAVLSVQSDLSPEGVLSALMGIESELGRVRSEANAARGVDLDLIAYNDQVINMPNYLQIPHPRMHQRAFVLEPLLEICPQWVHPVLGQTPAQLLLTLNETLNVA